MTSTLISYCPHYTGLCFLRKGGQEASKEAAFLPAKILIFVPQHGGGGNCTHRCQPLSKTPIPTWNHPTGHLATFPALTPPKSRGPHCCVCPSYIHHPLKTSTCHSQAGTSRTWEGTAASHQRNRNPARTIHQGGEPWWSPKIEPSAREGHGSEGGFSPAHKIPRRGPRLRLSLIGASRSASRSSQHPGTPQRRLGPSLRAGREAQPGRAKVAWNLSNSRTRARFLHNSGRPPGPPTPLMGSTGWGGRGRPQRGCSVRAGSQPGGPPNCKPKSPNPTQPNPQSRPWTGLAWPGLAGPSSCSLWPAVRARPRSQTRVRERGDPDRVPGDPASGHVHSPARPLAVPRGLHGQWAAPGLSPARRSPPPQLGAGQGPLQSQRAALGRRRRRARRLACRGARGAAPPPASSASGTPARGTGCGVEPGPPKTTLSGPFQARRGCAQRGSAHRDSSPFPKPQTGGDRVPMSPPRTGRDHAWGVHAAPPSLPGFSGRTRRRAQVRVSGGGDAWVPPPAAWAPILVGVGGGRLRGGGPRAAPSTQALRPPSPGALPAPLARPGDAGSVVATGETTGTRPAPPRPASEAAGLPAPARSTCPVVAPTPLPARPQRGSESPWTGSPSWHGEASGTGVRKSEKVWSWGGASSRIFGGCFFFWGGPQAHAVPVLRVQRMWGGSLAGAPSPDPAINQPEPQAPTAVLAQTHPAGLPGRLQRVPRRSPAPQSANDYSQAPACPANAVCASFQKGWCVLGAPHSGSSIGQEGGRVPSLDWGCSGVQNSEPHRGWLPSQVLQRKDSHTTSWCEV